MSLPAYCKVNEGEVMQEAIKEGNSGGFGEKLHIVEQSLFKNPKPSP